MIYTPPIKNSNKMTDFDIEKVNVLKNYNIQSTRTVTDEMYEEAYNIYKKETSWFNKIFNIVDRTLEVRLKSLEQVARYLYIAAGNGLSETEIFETLKANRGK